MDKVLINKVIENLELSVENLYQENKKEAMSKIAEQIPSIAAIVSEVEDKEMQTKLLGILSEMLPAMEENDTTLLADLINYELIDFLKSL